MNTVEAILIQIKNNITGELTRLSNGILNVDNIKVNFNIPEADHGDYMTNVAMMYAKDLKMKSNDLALIFINKIEKIDGIEKVEVAGLGFINFYLQPNIIRNSALCIGDIKTKYTDKKVLVEHTSINLFKPFSIGHIINNIEGEFIARSLRFGGANVRTLCFPSDISMGIAKAIYIIKKDGGTLNSLIPGSDKLGIMKYLGNAYSRGVLEYDKSEEVKKNVRDILKNLYYFSGQDYQIYEVSKKYNLEYFEYFLKNINSGFDLKPIYESEAGLRGSSIVNEYTGKDSVFHKSEGAIVYTPDESRKDIHTGVFINSEGYPTYEAKDIGLIDLKFKTQIDGYTPDISITVTDAEQMQHFKLVLDAHEKILIKKGYTDINAKLETEKNIHIPHGRMLFKGQKMSSRLGGVPMAEEVLSVIIEEVKEKMGDKVAHLNDQDRNILAKEIGLSAIRIAVLRAKPGININFDPEVSLSFDGDSGPYLMYTHARCASLIDKSNIAVQELEKGLFFDKSVDSILLEKNLMYFNFILKDSIENIAPQKLVAYLFTIAHDFNSYYANTKILTDNDIMTKHSVQIVYWTKEVLRQGLNVLGIKAVDIM